MTAAQMGRETIKKLRDGGDSSVIDSTAVRGSHEYSADSDTVFALTKVRDETDKINIITIKSRHGPKQDGQLKVVPDRCLISSMKDIQERLGGDCSFSEIESESLRPIPNE
jgi:hypothetical protein